MGMVSVRLTDGEEEALRQQAAAAGRTLSDTIRERLTLPVRHRPRHPKAADLAATLACLGRIGGHLNQLARWCNQHRDTPGLDALREALADIRAAREAIEREVCG